MHYFHREGVDQAYRNFVFHPFAITFSSSAEEQYPGFALSALFLFEPAALMSLRHRRLSFIKRMLYGFSNIRKPETRGGTTKSRAIRNLDRDALPEPLFPGSS